MGTVDDIYIDIIPVVLGRGESIFEAPNTGTFTQLQFTNSATYTHIHYRIDRTAA